MTKRPRKPRSPIPPRAISTPSLDLVASTPPGAIAQREQPWTVPVADSLLEEFHGSPSVQAAELREKAETYEDGPEAALAIADELERRARVGVRHWPGSAAARREGRADLQRTIEGAQRAAPDDVADPPAPEGF